MGHPHLRRLLRLGLLALPGMGIACSHLPTNDNALPGPMSQLPHKPVDGAMGVPPMTSPSNSGVRLTSATTTCPAPEPLPISLDTVLRLAEQQLAAASWLPDIYLGVGYDRHDGGIQLQSGALITSDTNALDMGLRMSAEYNFRDHTYKQVEAARKMWQNQGELSKITYEQLVDASTTYIDFLAACSALAISIQFEKNIQPSYDQVMKMYNMDATADVLLEKYQIEGARNYQQCVQKTLRGQIEALSAKLCYTLGLDPHTQLVP